MPLLIYPYHSSMYGCLAGRPLSYSYTIKPSKSRRSERKPKVASLKLSEIQLSTPPGTGTSNFTSGPTPVRVRVYCDEEDIFPAEAAARQATLTPQFDGRGKMVGWLVRLGLRAAKNCGRRIACQEADGRVYTVQVIE